MTDFHLKFGLTFNPFIKNSKDIIVKTTEYNEATARLDMLLKTHGFGLLTGSPGKGKTTILRNWAKGLNPSLYTPVYTCLATLTVMEFYRNLAMSMNLTPAFRKADNFNMIQQEIIRQSVERKNTPVFIIDEASYISHSILNDLKMLFNFEMDSRDRAVVILCGLPMINNILRLAAHEPLRQRLTVNYNISALSKEDSRTYISEKLKAAGAADEIFAANAIETIINTAEGIPRMIDKYCHTSMMISSLEKGNTVSAEHVLKAIDETTLD